MQVTDGDERQQVTCVNEGISADALTYGAIYDVIAWDKIKCQMKVRGDNGRIRWYPSYCFEMSARAIPRLVHVLSCNPLDESVAPIVEVDIELSDGERCWCDFVTPAWFSQLGGEKTFNSGWLLFFNVSHIIVVSAISQEMIEASLKYIECEGRLLECTQVIDKSSSYA